MHESIDFRINSVKANNQDYQVILEEVLAGEVDDKMENLANNLKEANIDQLFRLVETYNNFSYDARLELFLLQVLKNSHHLMFKDYVCIEELIQNGRQVKAYCLEMATNKLKFKSEVMEKINF